MKSTLLTCLMASLTSVALSLPATAPKYIFTILVDDLGWGDVGFHRQNPSAEVVTPNIDSLAYSGVILDRHYVSFTCTPSRSSFLSGREPVHVQTTLDNPEQPNSGIPSNMTAIASKLKEAGYRTYVTGKWDAGMVTNQHTPEGRGFDSSLIYFEHKVDYYTQNLMQSTCQQYNPIVDLWDTGAPAKALNGTNYVEYIFRDRVYNILSTHNLSEPLFMLYTPHVAHCPLQVPPEQLAKFAFMTDDEQTCQAQTPYIYPGSTPADYRCRAQYAAMVNLLDDIIGNLTSVLKSRGMWDDTFILFTTDNGGPEDIQESGANNYPLRGGKYSWFEGGVRGTAFVSGGFLPQSVQGTNQSGIIHISDWYRTWIELAGIDPTDYVAQVAGLPPIDSLNVWDLVTGVNSTSPRVEIPFSPTAFISGQYKLLLGPNDQATWPGPQYPNSSSVNSPVYPGPTLACKNGCLFDVLNDPTETTDIAAQHPEIVTQMTTRLNTLAKGFYSNNDTNFNYFCPKNITMPCACWAALNIYDGYFGPYAS